MRKILYVIKLSQPKAKAAIHNIWQAETREDAQKAFDLFITTYEAKYPKATLCLQKDREELMAFFDFPAQHWQSIRTTNPIEFAFATIRHRTKRSKGCLSRDGMLQMMFKLGQAALPWLYLKGVSSGEMGAALKVLLGPDAAGLSANTVSRLKRNWAEEYCGWREAALDDEPIVYIWADGVHSGLRGENDKLCALVIVGVTARGKKRFLAIEDGVRESTQSWREVLLNLKSRGMNTPRLAIGDGAMGLWSALEEVYPQTRQQRCWQHKTMNVLNCLPRLSQPKAKAALHNIWQAETRDDADKAFDLFIKTYEPKYPKAALCLQKDREELMAFFDFPAQHWQSIRTSNPIESAFATIRHRTKRSKGCLSRDGMLHMMFKLGQCAEQNWRKLRGFDYLAKVITGVQFKDGIETTNPSQVAA